MRPDVELRDRQLLVGGVPRVLRAGEVHYFRLERDGWRRRLELLRDAGADTVATYMPWGVHELADGTLDLVGRTRPELDLGAFCDLAADLGLFVLARPGPFQMAELRHEGVPGRLAREHPELVPRGWDGAPAPTSDLDVLGPAFLAETRRWYAAVGEVLAPRLAPRGGPVVAVQLDNEVGMLSWVSNTPVLTEHAVAELRERVRARAGAYPPADAPLQEWVDAVRSPSSSLLGDLRIDLADLHRARAARYVAWLATTAREHGFGDVPLLVNVHGTAAGRAAPLPIGISQLQRTWHRQHGTAGLTAGSDHYVGSLTPAVAAELHLAHAFLKATLGPDQPMAALEHECGTGDYGSDLGALIDPESDELKTRLLLAQGCRLFNWYLFAGGENWADPRPDEAQARIGITGQRHGAAAPVTPEGTPGPAYAGTAAAMQAVAALEPWAAVWEPEHDDVAVAYLPSAFATEHVHPGDDAGRARRADLEEFRFGGPRGQLPRVLLGQGYRFGAVDLERCDDGDDPHDDGGTAFPTVLVVGAGRVLDAGVQRRLVAHVRGGGGLLLAGDLPQVDLRGGPCTVLADALGLAAGEVVRSGPGAACDVQPTAEEPTAELRAGRLTPLTLRAGAERTEVLAVEAATGAPCAVAVGLGSGRAVVVATDAPLPPTWWRAQLERLGAAPGLEVQGAVPGLVVATTVTPDGERFLHLLAVAGYAQRVRVGERGADGVVRPLLGGEPVEVAARSGVVVPLP